MGCAEIIVEGIGIRSGVFTASVVICKYEFRGFGDWMSPQIPIPIILPLPPPGGVPRGYTTLRPRRVVDDASRASHLCHRRGGRKGRTGRGGAPREGANASGSVLRRVEGHPRDLAILYPLGAVNTRGAPTPRGAQSAIIQRFGEASGRSERLRESDALRQYGENASPRTLLDNRLATRASANAATSGRSAGCLRRWSDTRPVGP